MCLLHSSKDNFVISSYGGHYASVKAQARELLDSYGVAYTNWNCLTGDAENKKTKEACMEEMINTKGKDYAMNYMKTHWPKIDLSKVL